MFGYKLVKKKDLQDFKDKVHDITSYVDHNMVMMDSKKKVWKKEGANSEELGSKWSHYWDMVVKLNRAKRKL